MRRRGFSRGSSKPAWIPTKSRSYIPDSTRRRITVDKPHNPNSVQEVCLITNSYSLDTIVDAPTIHEYQLTINPSEGYKNLSSKVLLRNFVSRSIKKLIMLELVPELVGSKLAKESVVIEPNLEAIYSLKPFNMNIKSSSPSLHIPLSAKDVTIFENVRVETDLISLLRVDIVIRYLGQFKMNVSHERGHKILTSALHHQLAIDLLRYGSVYYKSQDQVVYNPQQRDRLDLISQHIMGISISGIRRSINDQNLIVINCPHSYITNSMRLIDVLATFIVGRPVEGLELFHSNHGNRANIKLMPEIIAICGTEQWFRSFASILDGFKCRADVLGEHVNLRFNLTQESAAALIMDETTSLTVEAYYKQVGIHLSYPNLPCLKSFRSERHPYYPLEVCSLMSGIKVPIFRLSSAARNELALLNKPKPDASKQLSSRARDELSVTVERQFRTFGINLSRDPIETKGFTLPKPKLQYRGREIEPQRDYWESGIFYQAMHLVHNWCVVNTVPIESSGEEAFFFEFSKYCERFGFSLGKPIFLFRSKDHLLEQDNSIELLIQECQKMTDGKLRFIMFVIDSGSTALNRLVHLTFDEHPSVTASCLRVESILNHRQHRSIYRTLIHKLNARLGGTNVSYDNSTLAKLSLSCEDIMVVGLDVTHPDNELNGVSIVGCAYTYSKDLFKHRSLVWPQAPRAEIITKMDLLMKRLTREYYEENKNHLPKQIIIYRDGVSHEEFDKVRATEVSKAQLVLEEISRLTEQSKPILTYIIAQKRHTMRFFHMTAGNAAMNPPSGTLIDQDVVSHSGREFYLYSNTSPQATARPLHYHVLLNGLGIENLQKLTYFLCFNFGKCSGTLSMPSSLRYAHNAAYDARNRVIAAREFSENRFYTSKFFC